MLLMAQIPWQGMNNGAPGFLSRSYGTNANVKRCTLLYKDAAVGPRKKKYSPLYKSWSILRTGYDVKKRFANFISGVI